MMFYTDNPLNDWDNHCREQERELAKRQRCSQCDEPIQTERCYYIYGEYICKRCMNEYVVDTPIYESEV